MSKIPMLKPRTALQDVAVEYVAIGELIPYAMNSRTHSDEQVAQIAASISEFGWTNPVLVDEHKGIIAGHGRVLAARKLGIERIPCIELAHMTEAQKRAYVIADNKLALNAGWDDEVLALELKALQDDGFDLELTGFDDAELAALLDDGGDDEQPEGASGEGRGSLADRFLLPPFTVLNAREGWWQERKGAWLALGIKSEVGREDGLTFALSSQPPSAYEAKGRYEAEMGRKASWEEFAKAHPEAIAQEGTSVFDPVLCEVAYRWFCPAGGTVLDPFAGGSVRGIVAAKLGRWYVGHELREAQVAANREQAAVICADDATPPSWICGDSRGIDRTCADVEADFVFSCPPYADLEVYSDDPADLSTLGYDEFRAAYFEIIAKACARLRNDRFACFVVGEVRDKRGNYYDFVGDTVEAFRAAGLHYYNEAILVTATGSLPIRAGRQFSASRKLGKTHQNVLVFVKGDGKRAAAACGEVEIDEALFVDEGGEGGLDAQAEALQ